MSNRRNAGKLAPFIAMDRHQYKSAAFAALSAVAQALLVHLTYNYNSKMQNSVYVPARTGAKKLHVSKSAVAYAMQELEHYGFIVKVRGARLGVNGKGDAAHYRLTAQPYGEVGVTRDYDKWSGELFNPVKHAMTQADKERLAERKKQNPVHAEGHPVHREGQREGEAAPQKMEQASTGKDKETPPPCPPVRTYLVSPARSAAEAEQAQPEPAQQPPARQDPEHPMSALREWSTPVMTEIEYTPELRRLYCEAIKDERPAKRDDAGDILKKYATRVIATATPTVH